MEDIEDITPDAPQAHDDVEDITPDHKQGWGEYLGRGATGALPYAAGIGGAMAGSAAGPVGSVAAGGLGYAGGAEARDLLNHYLFGDKQNSTKPMDQLKRVLGNTVEGGTQEMGGQVIGNLISRAAKPLARTAEDFAVKHLRPTPKVAQVLGKEKLRDIGREGLDSGAIGFGRKAETTGARLGDLKDESGSVIGDIVNSSKATASPLEIAEKFQTEVIDPLKKTSGNESLISHLEGQKSSFLKKYAPVHSAQMEHPVLKDVLPATEEKMTAAQVEAQKQVEQDRVNWLTDPKLNAKAQMGWSGVLKNTGEKMIDDPAFVAAKRAYGNQALAEGMANRTAALTNGGTGLLGHMSDLGVNLEALKLLAAGNPAGIPLAVGRGVLKGRGSSILAKTADAASKLAAKPGTQAATNFASRPIWNRMIEQKQ